MFKTVEGALGKGLKQLGAEIKPPDGVNEDTAIKLLTAAVVQELIAGQAPPPAPRTRKAKEQAAPRQETAAADTLK